MTNLQVNKNAPIADFMTMNPVVVLPTDNMVTVRQLMEENGFHHLPVVDEQGHLAGMISYSDYMKSVHNLFHTQVENVISERYMNSVLAKDVMTSQTNLIALDARATLEDAIRLFRANRFHALPVVGKGFKLEGIVTAHDLLVLFSDHFLHIH